MVNEKMAMYTVKVGEAREATAKRPSAGPVYRCVYAKDGLTGVPHGLDSPWDLFSKSVEKFPSNPMLGRRQIIDKKAGPYEWVTYKEVYDSAVRIGSAIRKCGVNPGGRCGIYGANCPEWIISMEYLKSFIPLSNIPSASNVLAYKSSRLLACNSQGVCYVPLYDTLGANAVEFIINHAEVSIVFIQEKKIPAMLACLPKCVCLKTIVSFGDISSTQRKEVEDAGLSCFSWEEFTQLGITDGELPVKQKSNICTIMYTSGTTGEPKGVILHNEAFLAEVYSMDYLLEKTDKELAEDDVFFSFLPLAHIFDQIMETFSISRGASIGFWQGDVRYLLEDLQELKPTIFCGVPRVFDRLYSGLTESCGGSFTSFANVYSMISSVGVPLTTIEARLESVPEMGYDALSVVPRGEICLRGKTMFSGYHKRQDLTDEVIVDGWFHTGDVGEWQPDGSMKIIDRKKNIFKLSQGEYVAVENIESIYSRCPLITSVSSALLVTVPSHIHGSKYSVVATRILLENNHFIVGQFNVPSQIWVYGNSFESFLVAVVVPERKALEDWAESNQETGDFKTLCKNPKARNYIMEELNKTGKEHNLRGFEMLRVVQLEPNPFDFERDLITPTFKLKRPQLLKYYKDCINEMYNEAKGSRA
ncbi:hypothetical protein KSS87_000865 [Heliosperma pusillum]|nr:hypothetical protein KSS87_000865 [Heliosperma pusillum]